MERSSRGPSKHRDQAAFCTEVKTVLSYTVIPIVNLHVFFFRKDPANMGIPNNKTKENPNSNSQDNPSREEQVILNCRNRNILHRRDRKILLKRDRKIRRMVRAGP